MAKSNRVGRRKVHAMVGYLCFIAGMFVFIFIGEPLDVGTKLSWQNLFFMCSIPWLTGYVGYNIGWLNGYDNGRIKARDDEDGIETYFEEKQNDQAQPPGA